MNASKLILIVEQHGNELLLVDQAFRRQQLPNPVHILRSAKETRSYLGGIGIYQERNRYPLPGIVVLDLNLAGDAGFELIKWIRSEKELKHLVIAAIDGTATEERNHQAYDCGANACFRKQVDYPELAELIQEMELIDEVFEAKRKTDEEQNG